jgi:hypothetical protein
MLSDDEDAYISSRLPVRAAAQQRARSELQSVLDSTIHVWRAALVERDTLLIRYSERYTRLQEKYDRLKLRFHELADELADVYTTRPTLTERPESLKYALSRLQFEHEHFLTRESVIAERWREWSQLLELERAEKLAHMQAKEQTSSSISVAHATEKLKQLRHVITSSSAAKRPQPPESRGSEEDESHVSAVNLSLEASSKGNGNRVIHSPFKAQDRSSIQLSSSTSFTEQNGLTAEETPQRSRPVQSVSADFPSQGGDYPRKWFEAYFDLGLELIRRFWIEKQTRYGTAFHDGFNVTVLDVDPNDPLVQRSDVLLALVSARKELIDLKASADQEGWTAAECKARSDAWFAGLKRSIAFLDSS